MAKNNFVNLLIPFIGVRESKMRNRVKSMLVFMMVLLSIGTWSECSVAAPPAGQKAAKAGSPPPSDAEIIKAIDDSGIMKRADGSFTVVPPVVIAEKGKRNKDGSWPVKVRFTLKYKMSDGKNSPPTKTTTSFRIFRDKDGAGDAAWKAQLGS